VPVDEAVEIKREDDRLRFTARRDDQHSQAMAGTLRALVNNMLKASRKVSRRSSNCRASVIRAQATGGRLDLQLGFSHPVQYKLPEGIKAETPSQTEVIVAASTSSSSARWPLKSAVSGRRNRTRAKASDTPMSASCAKKRRRSRDGNEREETGSHAPGAQQQDEDAGTRCDTLSVHRTPRHIYAQIIAPEGARVLVTASTLDARCAKWQDRQQRRGGEGR
jgi:hypothetical protein